jgi:hypothetical protein
MDYTIDPLTITTTNIATKITLEIISLELFKSCLIRVLFYDVVNKLIKIEVITLDTEYANWSNDDSFIFDYVKRTLNIP